jgi:hypothetical protein
MVVALSYRVRLVALTSQDFVQLGLLSIGLDSTFPASFFIVAQIGGSFSAAMEKKYSSEVILLKGCIRFLKRV